MFYDNYLNICRELGFAPTSVLVDVGVSKGALSGWKNGSEPSNRTKKAIADHLGITVAELEAGKLNKVQNEIDDEMAEILQEFRDNPDLRTLFCLGRGATADELRQYINVIKALRGGSVE